MMKTSEHVTRNQIAAFGAGSLATSDSRTVGGHLIRCVECRSLLPMPDSAEVWTAVTSEQDFRESRQTSKLQSLKPYYDQTVAGLFGIRNRLAWAGGLLMLILSLTALFIFSVSNQQGSETEMARSFEPENPVQVSNDNRSNEMNTAIPVSPGNDSGVKEIPTTTDGELRGRKPKATATSPDHRTTSGTKRNIATTRGATAPCTIGKTIEVEVASFRADLILRWKPVPKAAKYHLYVSDDSEVLVDEFETDQDTSYVLKKPLDPAKSYKMKIVITLESGQKLYVDAQTFTAKDFQSSLNGYKNKARSSTRCLAN